MSRMKKKHALCEASILQCGSPRVSVEPSLQENALMGLLWLTWATGRNLCDYPKMAMPYDK